MTVRIDGYTNLIGLLATPIRHSFSPLIHNESFRQLGLNYVYLAFEVGQQELPDAVQAIRALGLRGCNLSMPNKQTVLPLLDRLDPVAKMVGAVNTIVNDNGILTGYTTDGIGFMQSLRDANLDIRGEKMTITGAGGAGTAIEIQAALDGVKEIAIFNHHGHSWENAERNVRLINERTDCHAQLFDLADQAAFKRELIDSAIYCDSTSVGMGMTRNQSLITDAAFLHSDMIVYDVVYQPLTTKLMTIAQTAGVQHVFNGLEMLLGQGAESFRLWTGEKMPIANIRSLLEKAAQERKGS